MYFSKHDPGLLNKILPCLQMLLVDENVNVQKKVILTLPSIYKIIITVGGHLLCYSLTCTPDVTGRRECECTEEGHTDAAVHIQNHHYGK